MEDKKMETNSKTNSFAAPRSYESESKSAEAFARIKWLEWVGVAAMQSTV